MMNHVLGKSGWVVYAAHLRVSDNHLLVNVA